MLENYVLARIKHSLSENEKEKYRIINVKIKFCDICKKAYGESCILIFNWRWGTKARVAKGSAIPVVLAANDKDSF